MECVKHVHTNNTLCSIFLLAQFTHDTHDTQDTHDTHDTQPHELGSMLQQAFRNKIITHVRVRSYTHAHVLMHAHTHTHTHTHARCLGTGTAEKFCEKRKGFEGRAERANRGSMANRNKEWVSGNWSLYTRTLTTALN